MVSESGERDRRADRLRRDQSRFLRARGYEIEAAVRAWPGSPDDVRKWERSEAGWRGIARALLPILPFSAVPTDLHLVGAGRPGVTLGRFDPGRMPPVSSRRVVPWSQVSTELVDDASFGFVYLDGARFCCRLEDVAWIDDCRQHYM